MIMDRKFVWKLWTVGILSVLIMLGLGYLTYLNKHPGGTPAPTAAVSTPTPAVTASVPETTVQPESSFVPGCPTCPPDDPEKTAPSVPEQDIPYTPEVDIDSDDSITRLVNISYPVSKDYVPADLRKVNIPSAADEYLREEAAAALEELYQEARNNQAYLRIVDGYRSYSEQLDLYTYYERVHGKAYTEYVDDHPGASEHQLGLAADLGWYNGNCELNPCIATYPQYQWLLDNSYKYGWIARYPDKKTDVTHITYSPWHFRYVGKEEAQKIHDSGLTMEEYYHRPVKN